MQRILSLLLLASLTALATAPVATADHCGGREQVCWENYENNGQSTEYYPATDGCHPFIVKPCVPHARLEERTTYYESYETRYTYHFEWLCPVTDRCAGTYDTGSDPL